MTGVLKIRTTKEFGESTVSRILDLVENAFQKIEIRRISSRNLPGSIPRLCVMRPWHWPFLPPLVRMLFLDMPADWEAGFTGPLPSWLSAVPVRWLSASADFLRRDRRGQQGRCAGQGFQYLETLSQTRIVVFDKTGTLTQGVF